MYLTSELLSFLVGNEVCRITSTMNYFKNKYTQLKKLTLNFINPNQNPTDFDKQAFVLLDNGEVDEFITHIETRHVNLNVVDWNKASLLIKAQDVANDTSQRKKLLAPQQLTRRAIKAVRYLLDKGVNIDYQDKNGITALLASVHWGNNQVARELLKRGANVDLGSNTNNFFINPLISATMKNNPTMIALLFAYGANLNVALELDQLTNGFKLSEQQRKMLQKASNVAELVRKRNKGTEGSVLKSISEPCFLELCQYV